MSDEEESFRGHDPPGQIYDPPVRLEASPALMDDPPVRIEIETSPAVMNDPPGQIYDPSVRNEASPSLIDDPAGQIYDPPVRKEASPAVMNDPSVQIYDPRGQRDDNAVQRNASPDPDGVNAPPNPGQNDASPSGSDAGPSVFDVDEDDEASMSSSVLKPPINKEVVVIKMEVDEDELENTLAASTTARQVLFCRVVMTEVFSHLNKNHLMKCRAVCRDWKDWTVGFMAEKATLGLNLLDRHLQSQNIPDDFKPFIDSLVSIPYKTIRLELTECEEHPRRLDFIVDFLTHYGKQITKLVVHIFRIVGSTSYMMDFFRLLFPRLPNLQKLRITFGPHFKLYDGSGNLVNPPTGQEQPQLKIMTGIKSLVFERKICYSGGPPSFYAQSEAVLTSAIMSSVSSFSLQRLAIRGTEHLGLRLSRMILPAENIYGFSGNLVKLSLNNQTIDAGVLARMSSAGFPVLERLGLGDFKSSDLGPALTTFLEGVASTLTHLCLCGRLMEVELEPNGRPLYSIIQLRFPIMERLELLQIDRSDAFTINLKEQHVNFPVLKSLILPKLFDKYIPQCSTSNEYWVMKSVTEFGLVEYSQPNREAAHVLSLMMYHFPNLGTLKLYLDMREILTGYNGQQFQLVSIFQSVALSKVTNLIVVFAFGLGRSRTRPIGFDRSGELDRTSRVLNNALELLLPSLKKVSTLTLFLSYPTKPYPSLDRSTILAILQMKSLVALALKNFRMKSEDKKLLANKLSAFR